MHYFLFSFPKGQSFHSKKTGSSVREFFSSRYVVTYLIPFSANWTFVNKVQVVTEIRSWKTCEKTTQIVGIDSDVLTRSPRMIGMTLIWNYSCLCLVKRKTCFKPYKVASLQQGWPKLAALDRVHWISKKSLAWPDDYFCSCSMFHMWERVLLLEDTKCHVQIYLNLKK